MLQLIKLSLMNLKKNQGSLTVSKWSVDPPIKLQIRLMKQKKYDG